MAWGASASKRAPREWVYDSNYHKIYNLFTSIVFFFLVSQYSTRVDGYGSGYIRVRVAPGTLIGTRTRTRLYPVQKPGRVSIPVAITIWAIICFFSNVQSICYFFITSPSTYSCFFSNKPRSEPEPGLGRAWALY